MLALLGKSQTGQDAGRAWFRLVRFHLREFGVDVAQRRVQSLTVSIESFGIGGRVRHGRPLRLELGQLFRDFLILNFSQASFPGRHSHYLLLTQKMLSPDVRVQHGLQGRGVVARDLRT